MLPNVVRTIFDNDMLTPLFALTANHQPLSRMAHPDSGRLWITWETQRRNRSLSKAVGAKLHEYDLSGGRFLRYARSILFTIRAVRREKPTVLFVQNPSLLLSILGILVGRICGILTVVDAHNGGLFPLEGRSKLLNHAARWIVRHAPLTIVTNRALAKHVTSLGGSPVVLPDPLPSVGTGAKSNASTDTFDVMFICTWAEDEPYLEVIRAAEMLPEDVVIHITGRSRGREKLTGKPLPGNVRLTGFLDDEHFLALLHDSDLTIDLTTRDDCLVCGAYESVAANKPMILSDTLALRGYFDRGALFTDNTAAHLAETITRARGEMSFLLEELNLLRSDIALREQQALSDLEMAIISHSRNVLRTSERKELRTPA